MTKEHAIEAGQMLARLSIIGVAAILMLSTTLYAQGVGGGVNPGGPVNPGYPVNPGNPVIPRKSRRWPWRWRR
jgi:hypothetical protein